MKKLLLILIPIFLAQIDSWGQVDLGVFAGIDNGRLSGDKLSKTSDYKSRRGFIVGLSIDPQINDLISLSIQPGYISTGSKIQVPDTIRNQYKDSIKITVDYLILDIFIKIQSKSKRLYFSSGLEFGYGLSLVVENELEEVDISDELNKWNLAAVFGIGYKVPIKKSSLYFELRYSQGLVNMAKPDIEEDYNIPRVKISGIKFVTGFQIPITKRNKN